MNKRSLTAYLAARARRASARTPKAATFLDSVEPLTEEEQARRRWKDLERMLQDKDWQHRVLELPVARYGF